MLTSIETFDLKLLKFSTAAVLDRELFYGGEPALEFLHRTLPERMAHQLIATLKVPGQVLQDNRVLAAYPITLWDHIKFLIKTRWPKVGGRLSVHLKEVRLTEHLLYPTVHVPGPYADSVRLYVAPSITTVFD